MQNVTSEEPLHITGWIPEPINEWQLAAELGYGRNSVRKAIQRLEVDRLVVAYPYREIAITWASWI